MDLSALDPLKLAVALLLAATPLILASIGEVVAEKSGVLNLGVEGMMIMGAVGGFAIAVSTGNAYLGLLAGALSGALLAMVFAVFTQILITNQVATGLALTLLGLGLAALIGAPFIGIKPPASLKLTMIPGFESVSLLGAVFILLAFLSVILVNIFLKKTRAGLILRSVGENHEAAHAIGYNVIGIRFLAIGFGGAMAGLGGACISLVRVPQWTEGMTAGIGWIALALVVFGSWRPYRVMLGAFLFGGVTIAQLNLQALGVSIQAEYLNMLPYLMTILVLVLISRKSNNLGAPAMLGQSYVPHS